MKKFSEKLLSLLLVTVLALCTLSGIITAYADGPVAIDEVNFPDETFRKVVAEYYDNDNNGELSEEERNVTEMFVSGMIDTETQSIEDLKGIEHFSKLQVLHCGGIGLKKLDVSLLMDLTSLYCMGNQLTSLSLLNNAYLQELNCSDNELTSMSFSTNIRLTKLHCYANSLTSLDVTQLNNLVDFRCDQNQIASLDLTQNIKLEKLNCSQNCLKVLDLSKNTLLGEVTDYMIGGQEITLPAQAAGDTITVTFKNSGLNADNYRGCSLDVYEDGSGFDYSAFTAYDVSQINGGIDYECFPQLDTSENMHVHINITRSFYQVNFYSSDDFSQLIGKSFAQASSAAQAPEIADAPQCKKVGSWSGDISCVTSDMDVYPVWTDDHAYAVTAFDGDLVTVSCAKCADSYTVSFKTLINAKSGDARYDEYVDVTGDGYINAKDYAELSRMF